MLKCITKIQLSPNQNVFNAAMKLLFKKWDVKEPSFMKYVRKVYFNKHNSWFEGKRQLTPSTNNCLEATNARIKLDFTHRERPNLAKFKEKMIEIVFRYSCEYKNAIKAFQRSPPLTESRWKNALQWASSPIKAIVEKQQNMSTYYVPCCDKSSFSKDDLLEYQNCAWKTYEEYKEKSMTIWTINIPNFPNGKGDWINH